MDLRLILINIYLLEKMVNQYRYDRLKKRTAEL